jgi:hypothetical protein
MADKIANESHFSGGPQGRSTTATASGINALNPIALFQVLNAEDVGSQH